jgi:hypothetical protein
MKKSGGEVDLYRPGVAYRYRVEGDEYAGDRFQFGQFFLTASSARWAEDQLRGLAAGSSVEVYYDPASPSVSTLRQGVAWRAYLWAAIAAVIGTLAIRQLAAGLRRRMDGMPPNPRLQRTQQLSPGRSALEVQRGENDERRPGGT